MSAETAKSDFSADCLGDGNYLEENDCYWGQKNFDLFPLQLRDLWENLENYSSDAWSTLIVYQDEEKDLFLLSASVTVFSLLFLLGVEKPLLQF